VHLLGNELVVGLGEPPMLLGLVQEPSPHQAGCGCRSQRAQTHRLAFVMFAELRSAGHYVVFPFVLSPVIEAL
jgi:hypothetical protein